MIVILAIGDLRTLLQVVFGLRGRICYSKDSPKYANL